MNQNLPEHQINIPALLNPSTSPPASLTALAAISLIRLSFSLSSRSRLAFVLLLPLGATPVKIFNLSSGVKFTNDGDDVDGVLGEIREVRDVFEVEKEDLERGVRRDVLESFRL